MVIVVIWMMLTVTMNDKRITMKKTMMTKSWKCSADDDDNGDNENDNDDDDNDNDDDASETGSRDQEQESGIDDVSCHYPEQSQTHPFS